MGITTSTEFVVALMVIVATNVLYDIVSDIFNHIKNAMLKKEVA